MHTTTDHTTFSTAPDVPQLGFTGELHDGESALIHLRARDHDPGLGRFTRPDPVTPPVGTPDISTYVYANNQPGVYVDPTGMVATGGCAGVEGGYFAGGIISGCVAFAFDAQRLANRQNPFSFGINGTGGIGVTTPGAEVMLSGFQSTAPTVDSLAGGEWYVNADVGVLASMGGGASRGTDCKGDGVYTINASAAADAQPGAQASAGRSHTHTLYTRGARCTDEAGGK